MFSPPRLPQNLSYLQFFALLLFGSGMVCPTLAPAQERDVDVLRTLTDRWIELEMERAKALNEWEEDKALYEQQILTLEDEKKVLTSEIDNFEKLTDARAAEVRALTSDLNQRRDFLRNVETAVPEIEEKLLSLSNRFPPPLASELSAQLEGMQKTVGGEETTLARRIQRVLTVLTTAERFNNTLTLYPEIRQVDGRDIQVLVLYWGMSVGFAAQPELGKGWTLSPGESGWTWEPADAYVQEIADLIAVFEKRKEPGLQVLPVNLVEMP